MELEKAKELHSSSLWEEVKNELDFWIRTEELKLRTCVPDQLGNIQQVISAYEKVKKLPDIVIGREE
jgi:hypothetical protein